MHRALIRKGQVRLDIVGEFDHFDLDAFFGELVFHNADDLSVRYRDTPTLMVVLWQLSKKQRTRLSDHRSLR